MSDALSPEEEARAEGVDRPAEGDPASVPALLDALADPSWAVRREVVAALARLGDAAAPALGELLRSRRDDEARIAAAVDALVASSGARVEEVVHALAASPDPYVAADAAQIFGRRRSVAAVPALVALSRGADDNVAAAAIEALGRIGGRAAVDSLLEAVASGNFFRAFPAIDVLGRSGDPRVVEPLAGLLGDPRYAHEAARALGRTGEKSAALPLARLLTSPSDRTVRGAALALAELYDQHLERYGVTSALDRALLGASTAPAVRRVTQALGGAHPAEQVALCRSLGALGDAGAAAPLTKLLDAAVPVARAAVEALKKLEGEADAALVEALRGGDSARRLLLLPLLRARAGAVPGLLGCLDDADPAVRAAACEALARIGSTAAVPRLFALLADPDPRIVHAAMGAIQALGSEETEALTLAAARSPRLEVRRAALRIVAYFGYLSALGLLVEAIGGGDERLRDNAIHALPFLEDPRAQDQLFEAARLPSARARGAAMRALGDCQAEAGVIACLEQGLADPDAWVRYYACQSLGKLAWEPAAASIAALLADDAGQIRVAAIEALSHMESGVAFAALREAAASSEPDMQRAALVGLGLGKRPEALPLLLAALGSPEAPTRLIAVSAVAGFDVPEVVSALARAAADQDEGVQRAALGFLAARPTLAATEALIDLLRVSERGERIVAALSTPSEDRIQGVLSALARAEDDLAGRLVSALARMHRPEATAALVEALGLSNLAARKAAAATLGVIGSPEAMTALRRAFAADPDAEVRQICALGLAQ